MTDTFSRFAIMFKKLFGPKAELSVPTHPYQAFPLLLVSGFGRSGTTILRKSFAAHSQIHANDMESNIIQNITGMAWRSQQNENIIKNMVVNKQKFWQLIQNLILNLHWPEGDPADRDVQVISTASSMTGLSMLGLQAAFPNCLICYAVRNGIEVVSSSANFEPFKKLGFEHACREWNKHSAFVTQGESLGCFKLFRHEWLLDQDSTIKELGDVLKRVGLPFETGCADVVFNQSIHPSVVAGESKEASNDLSSRRERWKFWTDEQRRVFKQECSVGMERLGYEIPWK